MRLLAWLLILLGVGLIGYACWDQICVQWEYPDATNRRLWLDFPGRMWTITGTLVGGFVALILGVFLKDQTF